MIRVDVTGQRFGRLVAQAMVYEFREDSKATCVCDCGSVITSLVYNLKNGNTSSCGCLSQEIRAARGRDMGSMQGKKNATHGMSATPTYKSWLDARKRCFSPQNKRYEDYGARGITMCAAWAKSFEAFHADMGTSPTGLTLDRRDVNGNYEPGNCRWATKTEQARNTRSTKATWDIVTEIRRRSAEGESSAVLAREFGMCWSNAKSIIACKTWRVA